MADKMDRGLDEIIADTRSSGPRNRRGGGDRRRDRNDYPRDGVRKVSQVLTLPGFVPRLLLTRGRLQVEFSSPLSSSRWSPSALNHLPDHRLPRSEQSTRNEPRAIDSEWVHDRYEENNSSRRAPAPRRRRDSPGRSEPTGSKLKVENIHYDLTEDDLDELFARIGPVVRLQLLYDRAGRSDGTAYVTYEHRDDALDAIRQYDGANANGQPIRLTLMPSRNPFDTAVMPGRPLAERISAPGGRSRSLSPRRRYDEGDAARKGIDRYIPGGGNRSRSPMPPRRGGRRPGGRRDGEELDAEMADYFGGGGGGAAAAGSEAPNGSAPAPAAHEDLDMIE
ncbi:hypothetical protein ACCO45_001290 [Purpureocillium lilacinum]|uniref:Uncharacterized protein n=1 Tax=Purpureocillium lilacinum TaxID=33203 RepID=A0ACC4E9E9_PURLI